MINAAHNIRRKNLAGSGISGLGNSATYRFSSFQDDENIPLVPVPVRLQFQAVNVRAIFYKQQPPFVSPMGDVIESKPQEIIIVCPQAEPVLTEYVQKVFPIKNTLEWMNYASEKSKSKTGETEGSEWGVGIKIDFGELVKKAFAGEGEASYKKSMQLALSLYVEQAKKYLLHMRMGKINEEFQSRLSGFELTHNNEKYITDINNANGWMANYNVIMQKRLDEHFKELTAIEAGGK